MSEKTFCRACIEEGMVTLYKDCNVKHHYLSARGFKTNKEVMSGLDKYKQHAESLTVDQLQDITDDMNFSLKQEEEDLRNKRRDFSKLTEAINTILFFPEKKKR